jgi:DNA mismatch repair protein MutL
MAYPDIRFSFMSDNRKGFQTYGNGNLLDVITSVYGVDAAGKMVDISDVEQNEIIVSGLVSIPELSRSNRQEITFFINGRHVYDAQLNFAVMRAYHTMLMTGRYPIAVISLVIPPSKIDVNVHPTKSEVRFVDKNIVFRAVEKAVRRTLLDYVSGSSMIKLPPSGDGLSQTSSWLEPDDSNKKREIPNSEDRLIDSRMSGIGLPVLRVIGQTNNTFILAEGPDGMYMIDQHAAHERILYEEYVDAAKLDKLRSQMLLQAFTLQLAAEDAEILRNNLDKLLNLGFEIDSFGSDSFIVRAVPAIVDSSDIEQVLMSIVKYRSDDLHGISEWSEDQIIKRVCRLVAVRAGKVLSFDEQVVLLRNLERCKSPGTCPHGRPTTIHFSLDAIRNRFGRKG